MSENFEQFKKDFKRDVLIRLVIGMKRGDLNRDSAGDVARRVLSAFRLISQKDIMEGLLKVSTEKRALLDVFIVRVSDLEEKEKNDKLSKILIRIKTGMNGGEN
jgi:hypothetical protein